MLIFFIPLFFITRVTKVFHIIGFFQGTSLKVLEEHWCFPSRIHKLLVHLLLLLWFLHSPTLSLSRSYVFVLCSHHCPWPQFCFCSQKQWTFLSQHGRQIWDHTDPYPLCTPLWMCTNNFIATGVLKYHLAQMTNPCSYGSSPLWSFWQALSWPKLL